MYSPPASKDSYLNIPRIMAAVEITNVDAVHPGYGFWQRMLTLRGMYSTRHQIYHSTPDQIRKMGDKVTAKETHDSRRSTCCSGIDGLVPDVATGKKLSKNWLSGHIKATAEEEEKACVSCGRKKN
jgi:acetyl-CoA carboxylase biotin carboxylase subunit